MHSRFISRITSPAISLRRERKVKKNIDALYQSPLVIIDGNVCVETMEFVIGFCNEENIPGKSYCLNAVNLFCQFYSSSSDLWFVSQCTLKLPTLPLLRNRFCRTRGKDCRLYLQIWRSYNKFQTQYRVSRA